MDKSKYTISIKLDEEGERNEITIERTTESGYITSADVMTAILDCMKGLTFNLKYEDELRDMIEESRPNF